jgi:hypothetical protein
MILQMGFSPPQGIGTEVSKGANVWTYCSSDASTNVGNVAGYFKSEGAQPSSNSGQGVLAHSPVGMRGGDLVAVIQSSAGSVPGLVTWHAVIGSTFNQGSTSASSAFSTAAGFDVTVSSAASS